MHLIRHVPKTKITNKSSPSWIDNEVTEMSKRKNDALKKSIKTKSYIDRDNYKVICNRLKNLVSSKYRDFMTFITVYNISKNMITHPKKFWKLLASRTNNMSTPGYLIEEGVEVADPVYPNLQSSTTSSAAFFPNGQ